MGGAAEEYIATEHGPGLSAGEVPLADVEDVGAGQEGYIGPVVDGEQLPVPLGCILEHLEGRDLGTGLEGLVAQLDDVDAAGVGGVEELGKIALSAPGIGRSEEHTSELQSRGPLVCRLLLEKKKTHVIE